MILSDGKSGQTTNESQVKAFLENGFREIHFPTAEHAVVTTFPFKSTLSIFIGVARVYPKLAKYIQVNERVKKNGMFVLLQKNLIVTGK